MPKSKSKLVEPYVSNKSKGTGLGLAIVNKIITAHEGYIEFADIYGGNSKKELLGAEVKLLIPWLK